MDRNKTGNRTLDKKAQVAPRAGAWIETADDVALQPLITRRPSRRGVDRNEVTVYTVETDP